MSIVLRKAEKTTTLEDLGNRIQQVEDGGDLLVSLSTKTLDGGIDVDIAAFSQGAAAPPLGQLEFFTEPVGMTSDREATFFSTLEVDGSSFVCVSNIYIESTLTRVVVCRRPIPQLAQGTPDVLRGQILSIAASSQLSRYEWRNRDLAPIGYIKGMALVFAKNYCKFKKGDPAAKEMAKADSGDANRDALTWYRNIFAGANMDNSRPGADTLRHVFVLLTGLGMRESSGKYCTGRDTTANNVSAETAEAGLFQTSYNAHVASPLLPILFQQYLADPSGYLEVFQEGAVCGASDAENYGDGDGMQFQRLSKECPAFAAEFAAVALRNLRKHWGPINRRQAEICLVCDDLFKQVQDAVDRSPSTILS
jgi:hypothetical protein